MHIVAAQILRKASGKLRHLEGCAPGGLEDCPRAVFLPSQDSVSPVDIKKMQAKTHSIDGIMSSCVMRSQAIGHMSVS